MTRRGFGRAAILWGIVLVVASIISGLTLFETNVQTKLRVSRLPHDREKYVAPKIGIGFQIKDLLNFPRAWDAWLEDAIAWEEKKFGLSVNHRTSIGQCHLPAGSKCPRWPLHLSIRVNPWGVLASNESVDAAKLRRVQALLPSSLRDAIVPIPKHCKWGATNACANLLYASLLEDPDVDHVMRISESHIFTKPFSAFINDIVQNPRSIFTFNKNDTLYVMEEEMIKHSSWIRLTRKHAVAMLSVPEIVIGQHYGEVTSARYAADDEFRPFLGVQKVIGAETLWAEVNMGDDAESTYQWTFDCWSARQEPCLKGATRASPHLPAEYLTISKNSLVENLLKAPGVHFARKFVLGAKVVENERNVCLDQWLEWWYDQKAYLVK